MSQWYKGCQRKEQISNTPSLSRDDDGYCRLVFVGVQLWLLSRDGYNKCNQMAAKPHEQKAWQPIHPVFSSVF